MIISRISSVKFERSLRVSPSTIGAPLELGHLSRFIRIIILYAVLYPAFAIAIALLAANILIFTVRFLARLSFVKFRSVAAFGASPR